MAKSLADSALIVAASLVVGPPVGGLFAVLGLIFAYAWDMPPSPLSGFEGVAWFPIHLAMGLVTGMVLVLPTLIFSYLIGWLPALLGGVAFAAANVSAPASWPRPALGALAGAFGAAVQISRMDMPLSRGDALDFPGYMIGCGALSGAICAWFYARARRRGDWRKR